MGGLCPARGGGSCEVLPGTRDARTAAGGSARAPALLSLYSRSVPALLPLYLSLLVAPRTVRSGPHAPFQQRRHRSPGDL